MCLWQNMLDKTSNTAMKICRLKDLKIFKTLEWLESVYRSWGPKTSHLMSLVDNCYTWKLYSFPVQVKLDLSAFLIYFINVNSSHILQLNFCLNGLINRSAGLWSLNPNLGGLFRASFWGLRLEGWGDKITLCLKPITIMLETWNVTRKYTHICSFRKYSF